MALWVNYSRRIVFWMNERHVVKKLAWNCDKECLPDFQMTSDTSCHSLQLEALTSIFQLPVYILELFSIYLLSDHSIWPDVVAQKAPALRSRIMLFRFETTQSCSPAKLNVLVESQL